MRPSLFWLGLQKQSTKSSVKIVLVKVVGDEGTMLTQIKSSEFICNVILKKYKNTDHLENLGYQQLKLLNLKDSSGKNICKMTQRVNPYQCQ